MSAIADKLGITKDQIMSFGDFDNDVPMLKEAGFKNPDYITYEEFLKIIGDFLW